MKNKTKKYIDFSIDYDGNCECVDDFLVDDVPLDIDESEVQPLIEKLQDVEGFFLSDYRTQVRIWWNNDGIMDIRYRYYTEPDFGSFDDHELLGLSSIVFNV